MKILLKGSINFIALSFFINAQAAKEIKKKPNILFIAVDDMNDWISPLGGLNGVKTPNLERLAEMSMTFTNAHCASPACAPSRIAIMTGVHPAKSGLDHNVWYNGPGWRENEHLKDIITLEQFLKSKGYTTLGGGKIYHGLSWNNINQAEPESWDEYYPDINAPIPHQVRAPEHIIHPENIIGKRPHDYFTWGPVDVKDEEMSDYHIVEWANSVLSRKHDKPFFLAVGLFRPHMPWEVPEKYFDMYPLESIPELQIRENDLLDAFDHGRRNWHEFVVANGQWKNVIQAYMACLSFADAQIGRLLDCFENSDYFDNTIIVLWSDNGMHMGEKENWEKFTLWEESTRIPLMIRVPGISTSGLTSSTPVSLLDIYPTLAELIGEQPPDHCDGESLVGILTGIKKTHSPVATAYGFKHKDWSTGYSVRSQNYRYIYYPFLGLEELYDHSIDPNEFDNIADIWENRKIVDEHRNYLIKVKPDLKWDSKKEQKKRKRNRKNH